MMSKTRVLAVVVTMSLLLASGARIAAEPAATPRLDWLFDGRVAATARIGNTLYVGGEFKNVAPTGGAVGNFFALSPASGNVVPTNVPSLGLGFGISAIEPDGLGGLFVLGITTGARSGRVIHVRSDGVVDAAFQSPPVTFSGRLARAGNTLFVGSFVPSVPTSPALVALNASSGALLPWPLTLPGGDNSVFDLEVVGGRVAVTSGVFFGSSTRYVTAFDAATGTLAWQTDVTGAPGFSGTSSLALVGGRLIAGIGRLYSLDPATGVVDPAWGAGQPVSGTIVIVGTGSTIYVGGAFTTFNGQPRSRLAAVDAATGALLPWNPQASDPVFAMAVSPSGTVFVGARERTSTINGLIRGVFEIDAAGAVTPFTSQASVETVTLLQMSQAGSLYVLGSAGYIGKVTRAGLAAFDVLSGALLPEAPLLTGAQPVTIGSLSSSGQTLYLRGGFDTLNGQARANVGAVDVASGTVLSWPAPGIDIRAIGAVDGDAVYVQTHESGRFLLRRLHAVTGVADPTWRPVWTVDGTVVPDRGELLLIAPLYRNPDGSGGSIGSRVGRLDPVTGQFYELTRVTPGFVGGLVADGGTLYLLGTDPTRTYGPFEPVTTVYAIDRATAVPVMRPGAFGRLSAFAIADGRFFFGGRDINVAGVGRYGLMEASRSGALTAWDPGIRPYAPVTGPGGEPGGVLSVRPLGDALVSVGTHDEQYSRVAVFALNGATAPSGLRSRAAAGMVEFAWDSPAIAPAGGYVIEGGFTPGQAAATIPVGTGTTFATPVSVIGPAFIRVRAQGSAEVSNEIVAGCVAPPLPPTALTTTINGTTLSLAWSAPLDAVTSYVFSAGTASGLSDAATTTLPASLTAISGTVRGGTFFVRVQAANACGTSGPSGEVFFTIGAPDPLPAAPTNLAASVTGSTVSLTWSAPAGPVTGYVLEGGTALGLANIGAIQVGAVTSFAIPGAPPGVYAVRVRGVTSAGSGAPSADVVVVVQ